MLVYLYSAESDDEYFSAEEDHDEFESQSSEYVVDTEEKYYSKFFTDLLEATGTVPSELELPGYVFAQLPAWFRFVELIRSIDEGTVKRGSAVYLAEIRHVMGYLVEIPDEEYVYLSVDNRSTLKERENYYRVTGILLRSHQDYSKLSAKSWMRQHKTAHYAYIVGCYLSRIYMLCNDPARYARTEQELFDALSIDWLSLAAGMVNMKLLNRLLSYGHDELPLTDVVDVVKYNWEELDAIDLHGEYDDMMVHASNIGREFSPVFLARAGKRLSVDQVPLVSCREVETFSYPRLPAQEFTVTNLKKGSILSWRADIEYDRLLNALTDEHGVSIYPPRESGLGLLLTDETYGDAGAILPQKLLPQELDMDRRDDVSYINYSSSIWNMMAITHAITLAQVSRSYRPVESISEVTLPQDRFRDAVRVVREKLGVSALRSMVATLQYYSPEDKKAMLFCELAIPHLKE